jgi:aminomethyltransferase
MLDKAIPRHEYEIVDPDNNVIGSVTSGTMSPSLKKGIGMGYVKSGFASAGSKIYIRIRNKNVPAIVVKPPFIK